MYLVFVLLYKNDVSLPLVFVIHKLTKNKTYTATMTKIDSQHEV